MAGQPLILVVEDDDDCREVLKLLLEHKGFQVQSAVDGRDALDQLKSGITPSLILLDLMMPRVDGWEFRRHQASDPRLADIPTLVMSGCADKTPVPGVLATLEKPLDVEQLVDMVSAYASNLTSSH
jgi:two-component system response regulator MprA